MPQGSAVVEREYVERAAARHLLRRLCHRAAPDGIGAAVARENRDILLAVDFEHRRLRDDPAGQLRALPEDLAGGFIEGIEVAVERSAKRHATRSGRDTAVPRQFGPVTPDFLAGVHVDRLQLAVAFAARFR